MASPALAQGYYNEDAAPPAVEDNAAAAPEADLPAAHTVVVTSIEKCYAQLGPTEALDIQRHFIKPYEECQRRLALKLKQPHAQKPGQPKLLQHRTVTPQNAAPPPADSAAENNASGSAAPATPRLSDEGLYYRVQKNALPPPPAADDIPAPETKPARRDDSHLNN